MKWSLNNLKILDKIMINAKVPSGWDEKEACRSP
jgi:hypothetical protein